MQVAVRIVRYFAGLAAMALVASAAIALDGAPFIHDPSPIVKCDGRYYIYGTGKGIPILVSDDGFNWKREGQVFEKIPDSVHAAVPKNNGLDVWAPQVIPLNGEYYLYYSVSSWGSFVSAVGLATSPTLNPKDPRYKWTDRGVVVHSVEGEDLNAIDPGVILAPDGRLWISYGSYHGNIELVQLNPKTGLRIAPHSHVTIISSGSEGSIIINHGGYYYLIVNHGSCCQGPKSTYTLRVGRSRLVTGPYLDRNGISMVDRGGSLFLAAAGRQVGPGQFGLFEEDGVQKFSCHYEADLDRGGRPSLEIRPLLWTADGWPEAGKNIEAGSYQIRAQRTGTVLAFQQDLPPHPDPSFPNASLAPPPPASVHLMDYLLLDGQKWEISPTGSGLYKIVVKEGGLALTEASGSALDATAFTSAEGQLWQLDQLTDRSYRIRAKASGLVLTLVEAEKKQSIAMKPWANQDAQKWEIVAP